MSENTKADARIFRVNTQFHAMARRPGGVPKEKAIENANKLVEQAKPEVLSWMKDHVAALEIAIREIEQDSGNISGIDRALEMSREVRDVGTTLGFSLLTFVANNLCEIFGAMKSGAQFRKDIIACHQSALLLSVHEEYRLMDPDNLPELKSGLLQVLAITNRRLGSSGQ